MKQNIEFNTEINVDLDEYIEIDETQFSRIVDMIKKIGVEKFQKENYLSGDTAEELAYQYCQETIQEHINDMLYMVDDDYIDMQIIDTIQSHYEGELDENKN